MMSAIMDGLREPHRHSRVLWWTQHHPWYCTMILMASGLSISLTTTWLSYILLGVYSLLWCVDLLAVHVHRRAILCPGCSFERLTDDPEGAVKRNRWKLRLFHLYSDVFTMWFIRRFGREWGFVVYLIVWMIVFIPIISFLFISLGGGRILPVGTLLILAYNGLMGSATMRHNALQIWCPWCRRRDDDDDEVVEPEPDPADEVDPSPVPELSRS